MSHKTIFVLVCVLTAGFASAEVMSLTLSSGPMTFENNVPLIQGFNKLKIPGTPILPAKSIILALPPGSKINSVNVNYGAPDFVLSPCLTISPPQLPLSFDEKANTTARSIYHNNKNFLTSSKSAFPAKPIYCSKLSAFRNIPFVRISYFPVLYAADRLSIYPLCNITINYSRQTTDNTIAQWIDKDAAKFFTNWDEIRNYYTIQTRVDSFDYVILTKDNLFSAFDSLVTWKNSIGFHARLMSIDSVITQYPGAQVADRIRNFLIDKYISWGIHYLLIAGNVDLIPMKNCYPDPEHNYETATDYYFAELTDNWDSDGDGFYGEFGEDSIGFIPELMIGRLPYNDVSTLSSIAIKTVSFETDTTAWKKRALLLAAFNNFDNEDNTGWPSCDGAALMEAMKDSLLAGWIYTRMYEEEGLCPSSFAHEYALNETNVLDEWSSGNYAVTNWSGHGNGYGAYRKWWAWDDGDSIPEGFEMNSESFINMDDAQSLDDNHPSIIFAASCSNAEGTDNIARSLIGNGAVGIVAATNLGWYIPGWDEPGDGDIMSLDYYFYYYLIGANEKVGDAIFDAKVYYFNYLYFPDPWAPDPAWSVQQNMLDYTLFGDPALVREGVIASVDENISGTVQTCQINFSPNPMHTKGNINYSIPNDGDVKITLFNVLGQKTVVLYQNRDKTGFHTIPFAKNNLACGIYFLKMDFEGNNSGITIKKKIVLL